MRKGRWGILPFPALSIRFLKKICRLSQKVIVFSKEESDKAEFVKDLELLLDELSGYEPFIFVEVCDLEENVYVKIETL
jgi:GTPase involved in cell partitioning and DNA repair